MKKQVKIFILQLWEIIKDIFTTLHNKYVTAHLKWQNDMKFYQQYLQYQNKQALYNTWQLQLQYEMYCAFSESSAPINLRHLAHANDLIPVDNRVFSNGTVEYYFLLEKSENNQHLFSAIVLDNVMKRLNTSIYLYRRRFYNYCYESGITIQQAVQAKPLTIRGYQIVDCQDYKDTPENYVLLTVVIY